MVLVKNLQNNTDSFSSQTASKLQTLKTNSTQDDQESLPIQEFESLKSDLMMTMEDMISITKLIERIKLRTLNKKRVYTAFLSFTETLPRYLTLELSQNLSKTLNIEKEDLLKDKDTLIFLTEDHKQLKEIIEIAQTWSVDKSKTLNNSSSVLMEFLPRLSRKQELSVSNILDIPVMKEYKYKGLWLDQKLMFQKQIELIKKLSFATATKMENELENCSYEARVEAWKEFIEPLFESLLPGYVTEKAISRKNQLETLMRVSFRRMTRLKRNSSSAEIDNALGCSFEGKASGLTGIYKQSMEVKNI